MAIKDHLLHYLLLLFFLTLTTISSSSTPPPLPLLPLPSYAQLKWQQTELAMFLHFGPNTFTDSEWGTGHAEPSVFNPTSLDTHQWARTAAAAGFRRLVLTAKHHDGFCLWPSSLTNYSVAASPWRGGGGDVVAELSAAAKEVGLELGLYLSPWDRHEPCYGDTVRYNEYYMGQMTELLSRYGDVHEVFLDGAKGEGEKNMSYMFDTWFLLIHQLQSRVVIFSDAGPDSRWVGDEAGVAGFTCWSLFNKSKAMIGHTDAQYSGQGDPLGQEWVPAECDVSIRPGWFWHASEQPKSAVTLLDVYYKSVGRNCLLILNVPPNSSGLISQEDIQVLQEFAEIRRAIFSQNLGENATITASSVRGGLGDLSFVPANVLEESIYSYWAPEEGQSKWEIFFNLSKPTSFNVLQLQEPIQMGQRVIEFHLDIMIDGEWQTVFNGTTIGYKRLLRFPAVETQCLKLSIDSSRADPLISFLGIFMDSFSTYDFNIDKKSSSSNSSQVIMLPTHRHSRNASAEKM